MGFRTVVVLNNDQHHEWSNDVNLGKKISEQMFQLRGAQPLNTFGLRYGYVIECTHADTQSLALLEHYNGRIITTTHWWRDKTEEQTELELIKAAADKLGYRLAKKPKGK